MKRVLAVLVTLCCASGAWSQETRATLQGTVSDSSGAVLPGAQVTATHTETNVATSAITNDRGFYVIPYLLPGPYMLAAQLTGFRQSQQTGVPLTANATVRIDVKLEVGGLETSIEVIEVAVPLLQTTSASGVQALSPEQVASLPVTTDNTQQLLRFVPGMQWYGRPGSVALHGNQGGSDISSTGNVGSTEYTLDGVPNLASARRIALQPATETIAEVSVETASFDASRGHTSSGTVNMLTKSGANDLRGGVQWGHSQQRWNASSYPVLQTYFGAINAAEAAGNTALANELRKSERQASGHENRYSAWLSGPLMKDQLFFFASFNGYQRAASEQEQGLQRFTVPSEANRRGDFSDLLRLGPQYQIYDPRTARLVNGVVTRDPFPNNQVPILNPLYAEYLKLYPTANNVPGIVTADGGLNYFAGAMPWKWRYASGSARFDWAASPRHRFFAKSTVNDFIEDRSDWTFETARFLNSNGLSRYGTGGTIDWVYTMGSNMILNTAVAYNRFREGDHYQDIAFQGSPTSVGLPGYVQEHAGERATLPRIDLTAYSDPWDRAFATDTYASVGTIRADLTRIMGTHTSKIGVDVRNSYRAGGGGGSWSGRFQFRNDYVKQNQNTSNAATRGLEWAAFMLGVPQNVSIDTNDDYYLTNPYAGVYFQDDWRVSSRLTLNLGIRYEMEGGFRERFDRAIGAFDPTVDLPVSAAMQQGYLNVLPRLTAEQRANLPASIEVRGGSRYLNVDGTPRTLSDNNHNLMPRLGVVYQLRPTTVLRAGYGLFFDTNNVLNDGIDQSGFSRATSTQITNDNGLTFLNANLAAGRTLFGDPFPLRQDGTRFNAPVGSSLGVMQRIGGDWEFVGRNWERARQQRWRFGVQQELTRNMMVEVAYLGSRTDNISLGRHLNALPEPFWSSGNVRNDANAAELRRTIPNPFPLSNFESLRTTNALLYNDLATRGLFTGTTVQKHQLLRPLPHMGSSVQEARAPLGENKYDHIEAVLNKRFTGGASFQLSYVRSWNQIKDWFPNEFDTEPRWRPANNAAPHHITANAVIDLPFGKGRRFLQNGILGAVLGGWRVAPVFIYRSGRPIEFDRNRNIFWYGDAPSGDTLDPNDPVYRVLKLDDPQRERWFNIEPFLLPSARAQFPDWATNRTSLNAVIAATNAARPADFHRRVFPWRFDFLRTDDFQAIDLSVSRRLGLGGDRYMEVRADVSNLFNSNTWDNPNANPYDANFGVVTTQWSAPRAMSFRARFAF